jgi:hypothetical protein
MPHNLSELFWVLLVGAVTVSMTLIRSWIINLIDKRLEDVKKEIEFIKSANVEFEKKFIIAVGEIKSDIRETRHSLANDIQKIVLKLEQEFVQKKDCSNIRDNEKY